MNASKCHDLIDAFYADPVFVAYAVPGFLQDSLPRSRSGRSLALVEKENARRKAVFEAEKRVKQNVHAVIDRLASFPSSISNLFLSAIKFTIDDVKARHEKALSLREGIVRKYGNGAIECFPALMRKMKKFGGVGGLVRYKPLSLAEFEQIAHTRTFGVNFRQISSNHYDYDYPLCSIKDPLTFMNDCIVYAEAKANDDVEAEGDEVYATAIRRITKHLEEIANSIVEIFNGEIPTVCEKSVHWGVGGRFNGVLAHKGKRVSFKSFGAGGYNIQRYHYRFRITERD